MLTRFGVVAAMIVALTAAGCSSSGLPKKNGVVDPCALLKKTEVETQFRVKVTAANIRNDNAAAGSRACAWGWLVNGKKHSVTALVVTPNKATDPKKRERTAKQFLELDVGAQDSQKIDKLGDGAVAIGDGIEFLRGDTIVLLRYIQEESPRKLLDQKSGQSMLNLCVLANKRL